MHSMRGLFVVAFVSVVAGCSGGGDDDDDGDACSDLAGTYTVSGTCAAATCQATQTGCSFSMACDDGTDFSGTINGKTLSFRDDENDITCSAAIGSRALEGSCRAPSGDSCSFDGQCESGHCADLGGGSGGSSGGSSGSGGTSTGGSSGSGGSGGSGELDQTCVTGVAAFCTCAEDTDAACDDTDLAAFYQACVDEAEGSEILRCLASYVMDDEIDCSAAGPACAPE